MFLMKGTSIVFHDRKLHVSLFLQHTLLHRHYLFSLSSNISQEYCCNRCFGYWCGFAYALKFHWLASSGRIPGNSGWLLGWHCSSMLRTKFQRVTNRLKIIFNNSQIWLIFFFNWNSRNFFERLSFTKSFCIFYYRSRHKQSFISEYKGRVLCKKFDIHNLLESFYSFILFPQTV